MIELRGMKDLEEHSLKVEGLPMQVQERVEEVLEMLDESYGVLEVRELEGGKVIILENEADARKVHNLYDLSMNEFVDMITTERGVYLYILVLFGTENNIAIFTPNEYVKAYVKA